MATKKPMKFKRYDIGGEVDESTAKQRGLEISERDDPKPSGFFDRIKADFTRMGEGNIDTPGTEAYNKYGAGRGRAATPAPAAPSAPSAPAASSRPLSDDMYSDYGPSEGRSSSETVKPTRQVMTKPTLPASKPTAPNKQSTGFYMPPETRDKPNYSNEGRGKPAPAAAPAKPTMDTKAMNDNAKKAMADDPSSLLGMAGAGAAALFGASKLGKMFKGAKKMADKASPYIKEIGVEPKKLAGAGRMDRESQKADKAYDKLKNSKFIKKGDDDVTDVTAKKRGGMVKKYASGGMVSSASKRADGIASKGKTRCKIC